MAILPHDKKPYPSNDKVELREYIEALFREKERALDMAAAERDRAAEVLRDEQRRALLVAEAEREKAAAALRAGTDRAIADNYARLEEKLEGLRREISIDLSARDTALKEVKATTIQYKVDQNEWRGTVADVQTKTKEDLRDYVDLVKASLVIQIEANNTKRESENKSLTDRVSQIDADLRTLVTQYGTRVEDKAANVGPQITKVGIALSGFFSFVAIIMTGILIATR